MATITLLDGTVQAIEADFGSVICLVCGDDYVSAPDYCDSTLDCAMDDGESLVHI
jgi:hypothetical protein